MPSLYRAEDPTKVFVVRLLLAFVLFQFMFWGVDPLVRWYQRIFYSYPFMTASIALEEKGDTIQIEYIVDSPVYAAGVVDVWLEEEKFVQMCPVEFPINFDPASPRGPLWKWSAFIGNDCPIPEEVFRLCVQYDVTTRAGFSEKGTPFCSAFYDNRRR